MSTRHIRVETVTFDNFFRELGWPLVHLMKMDIEGAEVDALKGATQLLKRNDRVKLIVEFAPGPLLARGVTQVEYLETLIRMGFRIYLIDQQGCPIPAVGEVYRSLLHMRGGAAVNLLCERTP